MKKRCSWWHGDMLRKARKPLLLFILTGMTIGAAFSQTFPLSFSTIQFSDPDLNAPGRGVEQWHNGNDINVPVEGINTQRLDVYFRFVWTMIEGPTAGSYNFAYFNSLINSAIQKKQKFSFGIMPVFPDGGTDEGLEFYDGAYSSYPLYLHTLMQNEPVKDWKTGSTWTPNYNSVHYTDRLLALHQAINAHIESAVFNGVRYKDVIGYIDLRGYGAWGEWHSGYTVNNIVSDYPEGTFPTVASLKKIVDTHTLGFPNYPLVAMISAFDAQYLQNTWNPPEIAHYILTTSNAWGPIGWRRDQWGATDTYLQDYLENNNRSFNGVVFKNLIMERWKTSPINGEPAGARAPANYSDLERQVRLYHAVSFGNGNYGPKINSTIKDRVRAASKACGYRLVIENGELVVNGDNIAVSLNWKNIGLTPTYENWNVVFELKNSSNQVVWSGISQFKLKLFLPPVPPSTAATAVTDNFILPTNIPQGTYNLDLVIKDPNGYRAPLPLAINGRKADGSYNLTSLTMQSQDPPPPVNCTINTSITTNFNPIPIPAGRYIWFNSSFNPGSLGTGTSPVTINITNAVISFSANSQPYTLNVPNANIRFDNAASTATSQFINNAWETVIPFNYSEDIFMSGLSFLVPVNLPKKISNVKWSANIKINKSNISLGWRWGAAVYTNFSSQAGLNIKPISDNQQNPYTNADLAGTPENYKSFVIGGATGNGGVNYTGSFSSISTATCTEGPAQRPSTSPIVSDNRITQVSVAENLADGSLHVSVLPNPANTFFNVVLSSTNKQPVNIRVVNMLGQVVESYEHIDSNTILQLGEKWVSGIYILEVVQLNRRENIKIMKVN